jgi:hypothetical protein
VIRVRLSPEETVSTVSLEPLKVLISESDWNAPTLIGLTIPLMTSVTLELAEIVVWEILLTVMILLAAL